MDEDSQMGRYVVEIFKLTKTIDNTLEIKRLDANKPLFRTEVSGAHTETKVVCGF